MKSNHAPTSSQTRTTVEANGQAPSDNGDHADPRQPWVEHSSELAAWAARHLVVRRDCYGRYYEKDGQLHEATAKGKLTDAVLLRHFQADRTDDVIGLHTTVFQPDAELKAGGVCLSKWLCADIDHHGSGPAPEGNLTAALAWHAVLEDRGFHPLLVDSNGRGGYRLYVLFDELILTVHVRQLGRWLIQDWADHGLTGPPEVFPKQDEISPPESKSGSYGNWLRIPGRHHKRAHWPHVWDGWEWVEGAEAIDRIINIIPDSARLIPAEVFAFAPEPRQVRPGQPREPRTADETKEDVRLAREALGHLGQGIKDDCGSEFFDDYDPWIRIGMSLRELDDDGLALWLEWSQTHPKYEPTGKFSCEEKWKTFGTAGDHGVTLATLFYYARRNGWPGRPRKHPTSEDRPAIEISRERHVNVEATVKALAGDPELFRRGDSLGIVVEEAGDVMELDIGIELKNAMGGVRFLPLSEPGVGCCLTKNATFFEWRVDKSGEFQACDIHPPNWLIKAVATRGYWPGIRPLLAISGCPYVRSDGSIPRPGYDGSTGTLYRPSVELKPLPKNLSFDDATKAAKRLLALVSQFPFATDDDKAVWLAALLTAIQRPMIAGPCPGFAFNGNQAGVGKGLLIDVIGLIAWGFVVPTRGYPIDKDEADKVKLALALAAVPAVHFDNLPNGGVYGSSPLDSALTSTVTSGRILGASKDSGPVPLRPEWMLSGNNLSAAEDAFRRWLPCNLQTKLESPHERNDITIANLRQHVADSRAEFVRDCLIILHAHARVGRPRATPTPENPWAPLGSFEEWDRIVRTAVWFATQRDCLATQRTATKDSSARLDKLALLEGWSQLPGGDSNGVGVSVEDALEMSTPPKPDKPSMPALPSCYPTLWAAFTRLSRDGKGVTQQQVRYLIRGMKNRNIGGMKFEKAGENRDHATLWRVVLA
jgi:hypothetical protein